MTDKPPMRPHRKHILVCTGPRCAPETSMEVYKALKERIKELGLNEGPERIQRSQCHCFGICEKGPIAVVYPDDIWYAGVTMEKMERILREHLIGNKPVEELIFHRGPGNVRASSTC